MLPVAAIGAVSALGKVKKVAEIVGSVNKTVSNLAGKIGVGGVTQDRFIDRYKEIRDSFKNNGYPVSGAVHDELLTKNKIRKTQVADKKKAGNYEPEFGRLHNWVAEMLNTYNPGLGSIWAQEFPKFTMVNLGNISDKDPALVAAKLLIQNFKPGEFDQASEGDSALNSMSTSTLANGKNLLTSTPSQVLNTGVGGDMTSPGGLMTKPLQAGVNVSGNLKMIFLVVAIVLIIMLFTSKKS